MRTFFKFLESRTDLEKARDKVTAELLPYSKTIAAIDLIQRVFTEGWMARKEYDEKLRSVCDHCYLEDGALLLLIRFTGWTHCPHCGRKIK